MSEQLNQLSDIQQNVRRSFRSGMVSRCYKLGHHNLNLKGEHTHEQESTINNCIR